MRTAESIPVGRLEERLEVLDLVRTPLPEPAVGDPLESPSYRLAAAPCLACRLGRAVDVCHRHTPPPFDKGATANCPSDNLPVDAETGSSVYTWETVRRTGGNVTLTERKNVYSVHSIGSPGVEIILRRQPIDLDSAIRWRGQHCLITAIRPLGRLYLTVQAALVDLSACENPRDGTRFPAVMTERYLAHEQQEPMAVDLHRRVLVTPKAVKLSPGPLVLVEGVEWPIITPYELDPHKNEYEIQRTVEL